MKLNKLAFANALAATTAIIDVLCALAIALAPDLAMSVAQSWFHGLDLSRISSWNVTVGSFVLGLVTLTALAWGAGYSFAAAYNVFGVKSAK